MALFVYVDDIIIIGRFTQDIPSLKTFSHSVKTQRLWQSKILLRHGDCSGRKRNCPVSTTLHSSTVKRYSFLVCKPTQVPMDPKIHLNAVDSHILSDVSQYRRLIGRLLYLTLSRPDIAFAVHKLSQFVAQPRTPPPPPPSNLQAIHHLLRYLKNKMGGFSSHPHLNFN